MSLDTYANLIPDLESLLGKVGEHQSELPCVEPLRLELQAHLEELKATKDRQILHQAAAQAATADLKRWMTATRTVGIRVRSYIRSALGPRDRRLSQFGIAPLVIGKTRKVWYRRNVEIKGKPNGSKPAA